MAHEGGDNEEDEGDYKKDKGEITRYIMKPAVPLVPVVTNATFNMDRLSWMEVNAQLGASCDSGWNMRSVCGLTSRPSINGRTKYFVDSRYRWTIKISRKT